MTRKTAAQPVSAKFVRTAFSEGAFTAPDEAMPSLTGTTKTGPRGRLHPLAVAAFNAQVEGKVYAGEKSPAEAKTVEVTLTKVNARGAKLKRTESMPIAEVRRYAGKAGKRGRLSRADVEAAAVAVSRERGWL